MKEALEKAGITKDDIKELEELVGDEAIEEAKKESGYILNVVQKVMDNCKDKELNDPFIMGRMMLCGLLFLDVYIDMMETMEKEEPKAFHYLMNTYGIKMTSTKMSKSHTRFRQLLTRSEV